MIKIVTDTTSVLSHEYCQQHGIDLVPQIIRFGEETFLEGVEMDEPAFLQRLKSSARLPATAAPAPGLFDNAYRQAAEQGYPDSFASSFLRSQRHRGFSQRGAQSLCQCRHPRDRHADGCRLFG